MSIVIFAGPSIHGLDIPPSPDLVIRQPATQGDIFRACLSKPTAIGLIDGYFDSVPSVWHKEILWALSNGIPVFGSSSMGALRAAELDVFGMVGVGRIYQWYRDGVLEDDDEVALIHGPLEAKYLPLSEPMVNVRATCEAAVAAGILHQQAADSIMAAAKHIHYQDRTWERLLSANTEWAAFAQWKDAHHVDQKRSDAAALISEMLRQVPQSKAPHSNAFRFEWTNLWDQAMQEWTAGKIHADDDAAIPVQAILDELRLDPELFNELSAQAVIRSVLLGEADRRRVSVDRKAKLKILGELRGKLGLGRKSDLDAWAKRNMLTEDGLETMVDEDARIERVAQAPGASLDRHIIAILQSRDHYAALAKRAINKRGILQKLSSDQEDGTSWGLSPPSMLNWFFGRQRNQPAPEDIDSFVQTLGLSSRQDFYRLLADEYVYSTHTKSGDDGET
jgi:hypothetical protein